MDKDIVTVNPENLLTLTKAADFLGVNVRTLYRWMDAGKIIPVALEHTFFHRAELERVKKLRDNGLWN